MSDRVNLLRRVDSLNKSPEFNGITKLICNIDDETQMTVGDDTGYALEFENPMMTQSTLTAMLNKIRGYQYQPYTADGALLDPAAEMGDAVSVRNLYGGIFTRSRSFGRLMKADISAPTDEEIDHEYKFETKQERKVKRQLGDVRATLLIQAGQIAAKVSKTGGNNSSFGWVLDDASHTWYANDSEVMKVTAAGLKVKGQITATSGYIGNENNGFTISASAIYNGMTSLNDITHNGIYIGTNGISLGKGAFKVTSSGAISANNMTLTGTLNVGGATITADTLRQGAQSGYNWSNGGGYGGYDSRAAYALSGSWAGFKAKSFTDSLTTENSGITDIWVKSFHGIGTSYFGEVQAYRFVSYSTKESFSPMDLTVNGVKHRVLGAY